MRSRLNYTRERKRKPENKPTEKKKLVHQPGRGSEKKSGVPTERVTGVMRRKRTKQCNFCPRGTHVSVGARGIVSHGGNNSRFVCRPHTNTFISPTHKCVTVAKKKKKTLKFLPSTPTPDKQTTQNIP